MPFPTKNTKAPAKKPFKTKPSSALAAKDAAMDKMNGIIEGSSEDNAIDAKKGIK